MQFFGESSISDAHTTSGSRTISSLSAPYSHVAASEVVQRRNTVLRTFLFSGHASYTSVKSSSFI